MSGGGSQTTESGLPDWARPAVESSLNQAVSLHGDGAFSHVENLTPEQQAAMKAKAELGGQGGVMDQIAHDAYGGTQAYRDAAAGTGLFGADALGKQTAAMKDSIGQAVKDQMGGLAGQYSHQGNLGSARSEAAMNQALTKTGADIAANELANRRGFAMQGAGGTLGATGTLQQGFQTGSDVLQGVGDALQQQGQNEGDAAYQGIQRLFGLMGSPAIGQKQISTKRGK
tara:strand:+ start:1017 stop:1700 length:684 start_codon:yes stop_codon:yes gene_type:complete